MKVILKFSIITRKRRYINSLACSYSLSFTPHLFSRTCLICYLTQLFSAGYSKVNVKYSPPSLNIYQSIIPRQRSSVPRSVRSKASASNINSKSMKVSFCSHDFTLRLRFSTSTFPCNIQPVKRSHLTVLKLSHDSLTKREHHHQQHKLNAQYTQ